MSRRVGERAPVVAELLCTDPASLAAAPVPVLAAVWCCSVGATWTVELHAFDRGAVLGTIVDWLSSGVPISEPQPTAALARELLTERGFQLFLDSSTGPSCPHRRGIGYACRDADLIEAGTRGMGPGRGPATTRPAGSRIRAASPRTGGYPGTGASRPLRPAQPAHRSPTLGPGAAVRRTGQGAGS
jgi:hypothetical protein